MSTQSTQLMQPANDIEESRGAYNCEDFKERDNNYWILHTLSEQTDYDTSKADLEIT